MELLLQQPWHGALPGKAMEKSACCAWLHGEIWKLKGNRRKNITSKQTKNSCKEPSQLSGDTPQQGVSHGETVAGEEKYCDLLETRQSSTLLAGSMPLPTQGCLQGCLVATTVKWWKRQLLFPSQLHFLNCRQLISAQEGKWKVPGHTVTWA